MQRTITAPFRCVTSVKSQVSLVVLLVLLAPVCVLFCAAFTSPSAIKTTQRIRKIYISAMHGKIVATAFTLRHCHSIPLVCPTMSIRSFPIALSFRSIAVQDGLFFYLPTIQRVLGISYGCCLSSLLLHQLVLPLLFLLYQAMQ